MKPMNTLTSDELLWKQPKFGVDYFGLYQEEELFAEIYWTRLLSDAAIGRAAGGWWTFDRLGWLRDKVAATVADSEQAAAAFEFDWLKNGTLRLSNGRTFAWYRTKAFTSAYALVESGEKAFLEIEHGLHWFKQRAWVTVHFPADDPDLALLMCLAMYLIQCINQDNAAAAAAVSVTTTVG